MTVSSETYRVQYAGNGVTTAFTVPWRFLQESHVLAIHTDALDADTTWVQFTHYGLTGVGDATGTLTATTAPATGTRLTIIRDLPLTQTTNYVSNDDFPAQTHEDDHDKFVMLLQQVQEQLDRTIKLKAATTDSPLLADDISTAAAALSALAVASTLSATSANSTLIGLGSKTFTIQADKYFSSGDFILVKDSAAPATNWMFGQVTSYSGTTLVLDSQVVGGSGTKPAWLINLTGPRGSIGAGDLVAANNLSDVASAVTAFSNIKQAATDTGTGVVELATDAETITGTATNRVTTPANMQAKVASATAKGIVELATDAETLTGTDTTRATTPSNLRHLPGETGAGAAAAGEVGEAGSATGAANFTTTATVQNVCSLSIPAGDFEVSGFNVMSGAGATSSSDWNTNITTASTPTLSGTNSLGGLCLRERTAAGTDQAKTQTYPPVRVSNASTTTYYMHSQATFTVSTYAYSGYMKFRRAR